MCQENKGGTPRACPLYSLCQAGVIHWSFLLPLWSLLSYLICTSLSSPWAPYSTAFSKDIMVFSGPSCGRKGHQAFNLTVISANIHFSIGKSEVKWSEVAQSCPTLCDPIDSSRPGSSVHGIFQARILEWVAIFFSRGSSWPRDWIWLSCIRGRFFTIWATREAPKNIQTTIQMHWFHMLSGNV